MKLLVVLCVLVTLVAAKPVRRKSLPFIVGGQESAKGRWPWQLSQQRHNGETFGHGCGSILLNENWALTAAHCFLLTDDPADYMLYAGAFRISPTSDAEQTITVSSLIEHPEFSFTNPGLPHDIALMQLTTPADLTGPNVKGIPLPADDADFEGNSNCWITGWGRISGEAPGSSPVLMELNIPVIANDECQRRYDDTIIGGIHPILPVHICVGDDDGLTGACQGDSGGPLNCWDGNQYVIAGVTSRGWPTCEGYPSVYTRVSSYNSWIRQVTGIPR